MDRQRPRSWIQAADCSFQLRSVSERCYLDGVCCKAGTAQQQKESAQATLTSV